MDTGHLLPMVSFPSLSWFSMIHSISAPLQHGFLPLEKLSSCGIALRPCILKCFYTGLVDLQTSVEGEEKKKKLQG